MFATPRRFYFFQRVYRLTLHICDSDDNNTPYIPLYYIWYVYKWKSAVHCAKVQRTKHGERIFPIHHGSERIKKDRRTIALCVARCAWISQCTARKATTCGERSDLRANGCVRLDFRIAVILPCNALLNPLLLDRTAYATRYFSSDFFNQYLIYYYGKCKTISDFSIEFTTLHPVYERLDEHYETPCM